MQCKHIGIAAIPGSTFLAGHRCNSGDLQSVSACKLCVTLTSALPNCYLGDVISNANPAFRSARSRSSEISTCRRHWHQVREGFSVETMGWRLTSMPELQADDSAITLRSGDVF